MEWLIIANMASTLLCYLPVFAVLSEIEKKRGQDSIENIRGFARTNKYAGINLIFLFLSFGGLIGTCGYLTRFIIVRTIIDYFRSVSASHGSYNNYAVMICAAAIAAVAFGFLGANIIRIIVILLKNPETHPIDMDEVNQKRNEKTELNFSRFHIIYITFFSILVLFLGILGLFNILNINIGFTNFNITAANIAAFL
ncbi:MAG: hypothetical protein FJW61_00720 [Actinobacteria bacterium]|nr:hypothetical protein [Actinomycetota bacterium]